MIWDKFIQYNDWINHEQRKRLVQYRIALIGTASVEKSFLLEHCCHSFFSKENRANATNEVRYTAFVWEKQLYEMIDVNLSDLLFQYDDTMKKQAELSIFTDQTYDLCVVVCDTKNANESFQLIERIKEQTIPICVVVIHHKKAEKNKCDLVMRKLKQAFDVPVICMDIQKSEDYEYLKYTMTALCKRLGKQHSKQTKLTTSPIQMRKQRQKLNDKNKSFIKKRIHLSMLVFIVFLLFLLWYMILCL